MSDLNNALRMLAGIPPKEFRSGQCIELLTNINRLVRGKILQAGHGMAQLDVSNDPAQMKVNLIRYTDVTHVREPDAAAPNGNWLDRNPDRAVAEQYTKAEWRRFRWPV